MASRRVARARSSPSADRRVRGRLIVFEGGEGVGKSTQLQRLAQRLTAGRIAHRVLREPGGTVLGDAIRALLLAPDGRISPRAEAALFIASRAELVATEIVPALDRGETVLLDRFLLSTYAYQVHGRQLPEEPVRQANALATAGLVPDLTLLLSLPVHEGLARAARRGVQDRMEQAEAAFHERVDQAFRGFVEPSWQHAHPECGPIIGIDASGDEAAVEDRVLAALRVAFSDLAPAASPAPATATDAAIDTTTASSAATR